MTVVICALFVAALFFFELFHRRERAELYKMLGVEKKKTKTRHFSPHRKTLDEKRRINQ